MKAVLRKARISSKKANLVAGMIRGKMATQALVDLKYTPKKGADLIYKVLKSAVSNAENNYKQDPKSLYIKEIIVTEGPSMKRSIPISRGRMHPLVKRTAHISVTVDVLVPEQSAKPKKVEKKKPTEAKVEKKTEVKQEVTAKVEESKTEKEEKPTNKK